MNHLDVPRATRSLTGLLAVLAIVVGVGVWLGTAVADASFKPTLSIRGYSEGARFARPCGVAIDPVDGAIYVSNTGQHRIEIFSATGRPLLQFVHRVIGPDGTRRDGSPAGLAFDKAGRLLVVDPAAPYVDVLDHRARPVARLAVPEGTPAAVAVASDGTIFVGATGAVSRIFRFRADYTADGSWGVDGTAPGTLKSISAISLVDDSTVAVACSRTDFVVQLFTRDGRYLRGFGTHEPGDGNFSLPSAMATAPDGRLWVLDEIRDVIQAFDAKGEFLARQPGSESSFGGFTGPSSLAIDGRGHIAVVDRQVGRVRVFAVGRSLEGVKQVQ